MAKKKTKMVRVLFSVEVEVPLSNPNTMDEGPGPYLHGWLQDAVENSLSDIPGCAQKDVKWKNSVGAFELHSVYERGGKRDPWLMTGTSDYDETRDLAACRNCDGSGCPDCDPCRPSVEKCSLKHHTHVD